KNINERIKIVHDVNVPSYINFNTENLKGMIFTTSGEEIARLVNTKREGDIFDLNVRKFLGNKKGTINASIYAACSDPVQDQRFWFLNNGITIVCDKVDVIGDGFIVVKNMQIVNGCQTATTLALAEQQGDLRPGVNVLLRVYETNDSILVSQIVSSTNTQNKI